MLSMYRIHATDVVRSLFCMLTQGGVLRTVWPDCMEMMLIVAMLAAAIHDFEHKGVNNDFLIKTSDPLALLYNDNSPMENHHLVGQGQRVKSSVIWLFFLFVFAPLTPACPRRPPPSR